MASADVDSAVKAYFSANWPGPPPVRFPNASVATPPADGSGFIEVQYPVATNKHVGIAQVGNRTFREEGVIRLVVSSPRNVSDDQTMALGICKQLATLFLAKQFGGVTTRTPNAPVSNDANDNGIYWVMSIAIPYFFDYLG